MATREDMRTAAAGLPVTETIVLDPEDEKEMRPPEPPKKKKKKLTKAEKRARRLKQQQDRKKAEMRYLLRQELELSKKSVEKGMKEWENMCRDIKVSQLRNEIQNFEKKSRRLMEDKDEEIESVLDEIDEVAEFHTRSFETHVKTLDYLKDVLSCFAETSKNLYEAKCLEVLQDFYEEVDARDTVVENEKFHRENVMHTSNVIFERELAADLKIFQQRQDDLVNTEIAQRYCVRDDVLGEMKKLRKQLLLFVDKLQSTELDPHKYERIHSLMERQRAFVVESKKLNNLELVQIRQHNDQQRDLLHKELEAQRKINELKMEQQYFQDVRTGIENEMKRDNDEMDTKMRELCTESRNVLEKYKKLEQLGENLLTLAATCRKFQTEKEKVVPWDNFGAEAEGEAEETEFEREQLKLMSLDLAKHLDLSDEQLATQAKYMKNFWRRVTLIEVQNMLLAEEKRELTAENERYCERVREMGNRASDRVEELLGAVTVTSVLLEEPPACGSLLHKKKSRDTGRAYNRAGEKESRPTTTGSDRRSTPGKRSGSKKSLLVY